MKTTSPDWATLERLRRSFLDGTAGERDYWQRPEDLAAYDATFAQRIGWKWDFVLGDAIRRGWSPPPGALLDWGCGSGIAARAFLDHFPKAVIPEVRFWDRSDKAMDFAIRRARERFPGRNVGSGLLEDPATILLSHVLTELDPPQVEQLVDRVRTATAVIWVEPGTYEASLALIAVRERLRDSFRPVAPCPHHGRCGILQPGNEPHWCHQFADVPSSVFTDPFWGRFAHMLGIDLRSLPVAYLVLDRRTFPEPPSGTVRLLGRPQINKVESRFMTCSSRGVVEAHVPRRGFPEVWQASKKDRLPSLQHWEFANGKPTRIVSADPSTESDGAAPVEPSAEP